MNSEKLTITEILKENSAEDRMSCVKAFSISHEQCIFPDMIGIALNSAGIKITECQMGLFGCGSGNKTVKPAESVSEDLEDHIYEYLENDKLECRAAWRIASELRLNKIEVASACEKLGIKISKCQLGAF